MLLSAASLPVIPSDRSADRFCCLWLLPTPSYGLVSANAKFQVQYDNILLNLGLLRVVGVPQLLFDMTEGQLAVLVARVVDDILIIGEIDGVDLLLEAFNVQFKFGTVVQAPSQLRYIVF